MNKATAVERTGSIAEYAAEATAGAVADRVAAAIKGEAEAEAAADASVNLYGVGEEHEYDRGEVMPHGAAHGLRRDDNFIAGV